LTIKLSFLLVYTN